MERVSLFAMLWVFLEQLAYPGGRGPSSLSLEILSSWFGVVDAIDTRLLELIISQRCY